MRSLIFALAGACVLSGGCIVREIRDDLRAANQQLSGVDRSLGRLDSTNQSLSTTNEELGLINSQLVAVEQGLTRIDASNRSLQELNDQMGTLRSIEASLARLDQHLTSLRQMVSRLDAVIPFVDVGSGDLPALPLPAVTTPDSDQAGDAVPAAADGAPRPDREAAPGEAAPASRRDPLVGSWVSQYPSRETALVLLADGRFILLERSGAERLEGTWTRAASDRLRLTPGPEGGGAQAGQPLDLRVRAQTGRSLTVELRFGVWIFSRA